MKIILLLFSFLCCALAAVVIEKSSSKGKKLSELVQIDSMNWLCRFGTDEMRCLHL